MSPGLSRTEILNREFQPLLRRGLQAVAVLMPLICLAEGLSASDATAWSIFAYDAFLALLFIAGALIVHRRPPPPQWGHPIAFGAVVLVLISIHLTLHLERDLTATGNVGIVMIVSGFFFLSTFWLAAALGLAFVSWAVVMVATFGSDVDLLGTHSIFAATVAAAIIHWTRVGTTLRLRRLSEREQLHREELAAALQSAESEIAERARVEAELRQRVEIEHLISRLSSRFVNLASEELDAEIEEALAEIGSATRVDRTYVFQFNDAMTAFSCTHEWCAPGIESHIDALQGLSVETFSWIVRAHLEGRVVHIPRIADLPSEASAEREEFMREGIQSMLAVTLQTPSAPLGFMGFDSVRNEKHWPEDMISLMTLVAEIVLGALKRRASENALAASEERYRLLADHTLDVIWTVDARLRPQYISPSVEELTGYTPDELRDADGLKKVLGSESLKEFSLLLEKEAPEALERPEPGHPVEAKLVHRDGSPVWTESTIRRLRDDAGRIVGLQGSTRDITARKRIEEEKAGLEDQLRQSQKMEAIGTLAGGIAHDFNNLLTGILGYASLLKLETPPDTPMFEAADVIERAAERAAQLTRQLLGFARKGKFQNARIDMHETIEEVIVLLGRTLGKNIEIDSSFRARRPLVSGDPTQIQQVILNIAVNARDAMPEGGRLNIETEDFSLAEAGAPLSSELPPADYFRVRITDTGQGIPESIRPRIFDPFFTTKEPGKGTGMGLATAYGIVRNHGGAIQMRSEEGKGATFEILLPSENKTVQAATATPRPEARSATTARILLIDDEALVCNIASAMLTRLGYDVESLTDPETGLETYRQRPSEFDLVILDLVMPGLDGLTCLRRLREVNAAQRILLSSGFQPDGALEEARRNGATGFVRKPYRLETLAEAVAAALADQPA